MFSYAILDKLSNGVPYSLEALAIDLNTSIEDVERQIGALKQAGFPMVCSGDAPCVFMEKIELLDRLKILDGLHESIKSTISSVYVLPYVSSTNSYLVNCLKAGDVNAGAICVAEYQSDGRGRNGKTWDSPACTNLCLSICWRFDCGIDALAGLSLAVGAVLANMLDEVVGLQDIKVKWPNDLMLSNNKLGGILIDLVGDCNAASCFAVIGIGLNISARKISGDAAQYNHADINSAKGFPISRNYMAAQVINCVIPLLASYHVSGFSSYRKLWSRYDMFSGRKVAIFHRGMCQIVGVSRGVNAAGEIIIDFDGGSRHFSVGELSLRAD